MSTGSFGLSLVSLEPHDDDAPDGKPSEITPLLIAPASLPVVPTEKYTTFRNTIPDVVSLATPVFASTLLTYIIPSISLIFCGHLGDDRYLAAAGLASSLSNVTGSAVVQGLLTALDCLASQAFGCRNYKRFCTLYQRSLVVLLVASIPIIALWEFAEPILLALDQPPDVVRLSGVYIRRCVFGLWPMMVFESTRRFLQCQGIARPIAIVAVISDALHPLWNYLFIYVCGYGFEGAAMATVATQWMMCILLIGYILVLKPHLPGTWTGWSAQAFRGLGEFMMLAVPGCVMTCAEWFLFEIASFLSGAINALSLSCTQVLGSVTSVMYTIPFGFSVAICTLSGNLLGAGDIASAKRVVRVGMTLAFFVSLVLACVVLAASSVIPQIFTSEDSVVHRSAFMFRRIICVYVVVEGVQCVCQGVLRGAGKQFVGAFGSLLGFYGVALPVAYVLAFPVSMGLPGIWIGMCTGYAVVSVVYLSVVKCMNWERACEVAWKAASQGMTPDPRMHGLDGGEGDDCSRVAASEDTLSLLHPIPETDETSSHYSELLVPSDVASVDVEVKLE